MCIRDSGDTARTPYGPRPIAQTREFALECLDRLVERGVKALVIACNTASAAMLHDARERYDVPVLEVIRPAVRRAARATKNHTVGVISTVGTHNSGAYVDAFADGRDGERGIHLTGSRAAQVALDAGAKRLMLTHIPAWNCLLYTSRCV